MRDHGLTRPKVLILVPFREAALRTVNMLIRLLLLEGQVKETTGFRTGFFLAGVGKTNDMPAEQ